jgi:hypothetical protein
MNNDAISIEHNVLYGWFCTPDTRKALVEAHEKTNTALHLHEDNLELLKESFYFYSRWCVNLGILPDNKETNTLINFIRETDESFKKDVWALLYRLNCQVLRYVSNRPPCEQPCCCRCVEAPDEIACTSRIPAFLESIDIHEHKTPQKKLN